MLFVGNSSSRSVVVAAASVHGLHFEGDLEGELPCPVSGVVGTHPRDHGNGLRVALGEAEEPLLVLFLEDHGRYPLLPFPDVVDAVPFEEQLATVQTQTAAVVISRRRRRFT